MSLQKISSKLSIWAIIIVIMVMALITGWISNRNLDRIDQELKNVRQYEKQQPTTPTATDQLRSQKGHNAASN